MVITILGRITLSAKVMKMWFVAGNVVHRKIVSAENFVHQNFCPIRIWALCVFVLTQITLKTHFNDKMIVLLEFQSPL